MTWQLQEAKNKLSEVARQAETEGPQEITRHGRTRFILATLDDWQSRTARKSKRPGNSLREFYARYKGLRFQMSRRKHKIPPPIEI